VTKGNPQAIKQFIGLRGVLEQEERVKQDAVDFSNGNYEVVDYDVFIEESLRILSNKPKREIKRLTINIKVNENAYRLGYYKTDETWVADFPVIFKEHMMQLQNHSKTRLLFVVE
jgi:hypothetical protein